MPDDLFPSDDDLFAVNALFLGPPGHTLPWRARYAAYGVGVAVFPLVLLVLAKLHVFGGFTLFVAALFATIAVTTVVMRRVSPDVPVRAILTTFWSDVSAPRPEKPHKDILRCPPSR